MSCAQKAQKVKMSFQLAKSGYSVVIFGFTAKISYNAQKDLRQIVHNDN